MDPHKEDAQKFTLYSRHMALRSMKQEWGANDGATAVLDHGANPGLVSHFVKLGLQHIAAKLIAESNEKAVTGGNGHGDKKYDPERISKVSHYLKEKRWNYLAMELGVKVIHVSNVTRKYVPSPRRVC